MAIGSRRSVRQLSANGGYPPGRSDAREKHDTRETGEINPCIAWETAEFTRSQTHTNRSPTSPLAGGPPTCDRRLHDWTAGCQGCRLSRRRKQIPGSARVWSRQAGRGSSVEPPNRRNSPAASRPASRDVPAVPLPGIHAARRFPPRGAGLPFPVSPVPPRRPRQALIERRRPGVHPRPAHRGRCAGPSRPRRWTARPRAVSCRSAIGR